MVDMTKVRAPKPRTRASPCLNEVQEVMNCLAANDFNDEICANQAASLKRCFETASAAKVKKGHKPTVNYHLQRLAKESLRRFK
mmetsp:Transcript_9440/g.15426  ORF Transcript_9440/g.15426 Transcript_9440/m.15426 type:complete len:84 (+) Transcript_9440:56-307(+)